MAMLLTSCDEVGLDERLVYVEPETIIPTVAHRAVLIEDYTGQYCVNCPNATKVIEDLIGQYGEQTVIAVAFHSGPFGKDKKGVPSPLYTDEGNQYFNYWGLVYQPVGVIDRLGPVDYPDWIDGVNYELALDLLVGVDVVPVYHSATHEAEVSVKVGFINEAESPIDGTLQVWLVEDSIDSFQYMPDGSVNEHYNHMHVFRKSISDMWGDPLLVSSETAGVKTYKFRFDDAWLPEHCSIVAFFCDENGLLQQVAKQKFQTIL